MRAVQGGGAARIFELSDSLQDFGEALGLRERLRKKQLIGAYITILNGCVYPEAALASVGGFDQTAEGFHE